MFIPGNHDVDKKLIYSVSKNILNKTTLNISEILKENLSNYKFNKPIEQFKKFEKDFHSKNINYTFTPNHSFFKYEFLEEKVGFILLNDSWRKHQSNFGLIEQVNESVKQNDDCDSFILLHHHPIEKGLSNEAEEFSNIIHSHPKINLKLYGDRHNQLNTIDESPNSEYKVLSLRSKTILKNYNEQENEEYKIGYSILDFNSNVSILEKVHYRKYNSIIARFEKDDNGKNEGIKILNHIINYDKVNEIKNLDKIKNFLFSTKSSSKKILIELCLMKINILKICHL